METQDTEATASNRQALFRKGLGLKQCMLLALVPIVVVILTLLYLVTTSQIEIRHECQNMLRSAFPAMMEQQRTSINIERMRQLGCMVLNSLDPSLRRKARIEAQALSTDSAFESTAMAQGTITEAYGKLRIITAIRDKQHVMRNQMYVCLTRLDTEESKIIDYLINNKKSISIWPLKNLHATMLELIKLQEIRISTAGNDSVRTLSARIDALAAQSRQGNLPAPLLTMFGQVELEARSMLTLYKEYFAAEDEVKVHAQDFDIALRGLSERMSLSASLGIESMLQSIISLAMNVERLTWQGFMLLCACVIAALFMVRACVYVPLLWSIHFIENLRDGRANSPMPSIAVRELRYLAHCLTDLAYYFSRIAAQSRRIENEKGIFDGLSTKDSLTALYNRRYFDMLLLSMWDGARKEKLPLAMLLMEMDNFKNYTSTMGQHAGESCLKTLGELFNSNMLRPDDKVCRYSGVKFVLILQGADADGVMQVAKRIHDEVRLLAIVHPHSDAGPWVSFSIGVVTLVPGEAEDPASMVEKAERALSAAKSAGCNRTCLYTQEKNSETGADVVTFTEAQGSDSETTR